MTEKVRIWITFKKQIPYVIEVEDVNDPDEIRRKLLEKDPSDWETDPCFYETLGTGWRSMIESMTDKATKS